MSLLIELPESPQPHPHEQMLAFPMQVAALLQHSDLPGGAVLSHQPNSITIGLPRGHFSFDRDTRWRFELKPEHLKIVVSTLDVEGLAPLRAQSERMKLQLMILLRLINSQLPIEQEFFVEPHSGILRFIFSFSWLDYSVKLGKVEPLRKLVRYMLGQLNLYAEIVLFCQPIPDEWQPSASSGLQDLNRYRFLLRNTRKFRQVGVAHVKGILELKEQLKSRPHNSQIKAELDQVRYLFQSNIRSYEMLQIGLERSRQTLTKLQSCLKHISKNERGIESHAPTSNTVQGIIVQQKKDLRLISKQGAHSQILKGRFVYKQCSTINLQTAVDLRVWSDGKEITGQLVIKQCASEQPATINSFENELLVLVHLRDSKCSYMASYWLDLKYSHQRSAKDHIYMKPYPQNLYYVISKCKTLSVVERISIAYRLAKGFCFLGSKAVLHRDFKPQNVMVDNFFNPYIIDFGSCAPVFRATNFEVRQNRLLTTPTYQIYYQDFKDDLSYLRSKFTREQYNRHPLFDVYSFGCVLCFLFFHSSQPPAAESLELTPFPELHRNVLFLASICRHPDPDERPTFPQIASFLGTLDCLAQAAPQISNKMRSSSAPSHSSI